MEILPKELNEIIVSYLQNPADIKTLNLRNLNYGMVYLHRFKFYQQLDLDYYIQKLAWKNLQFFGDLHPVVKLRREKI